MAGLAKKPENRPATCTSVLTGTKSSRLEHVESGKSVTRREGGLKKTLGILLLLAVLAVVGYYVVPRWDGVVKIADSKPVQVVSANEMVSVVTNAGMRHPAQKSVVVNKIGEAKAITIPPSPTGPTEDQVIDIKVEAGVAKGRLDRISADDGFRNKKNALADDFARAEGFYASRQWSKAAVGYTNFVGACTSLESLSAARDEAKTSRDAAVRAKTSAKDADAEQHAPDRWKQAEGLMADAEGLFDGMSFASAKGKYDLASKQFSLSEDEAKRERLVAEKKRQQQAEATERAKQTRSLVGKWRGSYKSKIDLTFSTFSPETTTIDTVTEWDFRSDGTFSIDSADTTYVGQKKVKSFANAATGDWVLDGNRLIIRNYRAYLQDRVVPVADYSHVVLWRSDGSLELRSDIDEYKKRWNVDDAYYESDGTFKSSVKREHGLSRITITANVLKRVSD